MPRPTLRDVHVDQPLSQFSQAYWNDSYIAAQVFPEVRVDNKSDVYFVFDENAFFRRRAKPRAPGTRSQRADYNISTASYLCLSYALAKEIPDEVRDNADSPLRPDFNATEFVSDALMLDQEIRVANLTTGGSGLWGYSSSPGTQWSASNADPFSDITALQSGVIQQIGRKPNVAVMSWDVWKSLKIHPDFVDRVKHTRPGGVVMPDDLKNFFDFEKVLVGISIFDKSVEGQSASRAYVWGDGFWAGYVPSSPALEIPAAGYCLRWGSRTVRRFRQEEERQDVIDAEEWMDETITASIAGGVLYNAV